MRQKNAMRIAVAAAVWALTLPLHADSVAPSPPEAPAPTATVGAPAAEQQIAGSRATPPPSETRKADARLLSDIRIYPCF
jgi:hypothetical protein